MIINNKGGKDMIEIKVSITDDMSEIFINTKNTSALVQDICIAIRDSILDTIDNYDGEE